MVAARNSRWVSIFLILQIYTSLIHSASSDSLMLHVLARSFNAPHNGISGVFSIEKNNRLH